MYELLKHLLKHNEEQERKMKAIKYGLLIGGVATAVGIGLTLLKNREEHPKFVKKRIKVEAVAAYQPKRNRTRKIRIKNED